MKNSNSTFVLFFLCAFILLRGPEALTLPFILPFETAFQEAIALHHIDNGFLANHFLPVLTTISDENFYHTAHPPLLHILYALLYMVFGKGEWVTRFFSLFLYSGSVLLWMKTVGPEAGRKWLIPLLAFFLPVPFILATTTNYEPLSIFMISLIAWLVLKKESGIIPLIIATTIGMLVDWPVYLAVPVLLLINLKNPVLRKKLVIIFVYEVIFFLCLQAYQYSIAGEAAFFSHAPKRANPFYLLNPQMYSDLFLHFKEVTGTPLCIVSFAVLIVLIFLLVKIFIIKTEATKNKAVDKVTLFFALFPVVLVVSAPGLVSRHYVYLLYFVPLLVFGFYHVLNKSNTFWIMLAGLMFLMGGKDFLLSKQRNPVYYGMARSFKVDKEKTAFSSSAIGAWYYYGGYQTVHPVSAKSSIWIENNNPDVLHLDLRHSEVEQFKHINKKKIYLKVLSVPGEQVFLNRNSGQAPDYLLIENKFLRGGWKDPVSEIIGCTDFQRTTQYSHCQGIFYALKQNPGNTGSMLIVSLDQGVEKLITRPEIFHAFPFAKTDGVNFLVMAGYNDDENNVDLIYARFKSDTIKTPQNIIDLSGPDKLIFITKPGPKMDFSFDDAYWEGPELR
jgi:hypothetical protein